ncbi:MAG: hypothetical protein M1510_07695 [Nitrospirae bacterium]|nr:hypothetical protein [Nitrospirota bacterium]MCL5237019.1 hypothetical protein [Nitrospirota bacterium]
MRERDIFEAMIDKGMRLGALTVNEITDVFIAEFFSLDELEELIRRLQGFGIRIVYELS